MSTFVVDASAALAWVLHSQSTERSGAFIQARGAEDRFAAPHIFSWEIGNVLVGLHRRGSLSQTVLSEARLALDLLRIERAAALGDAELREMTALANVVGLSLFDTAYFALAADQNWPLVSRDARLLEVALARNVQCLDLR